MPWWAWVSIGILTFIALGFSGWYILSASNYFIGKKVINWNRFFFTHHPLSEKEINDLQNASVALLMVVGHYDDLNQEWKPLYLLPSSNISETISRWNQEIENNYEAKTSHPISDYLYTTNQKPSDIKFYLFHHYYNELLLNRNFSKLMSKTALKDIGFNKLIV